MASTSDSSIQKSFKYDVLLSFRGEDTRHNFVSHLYKALEQHGIRTYKDDETIGKGETIDAQLIESIEESRLYVIVFSKDYAGSSWCLDELVKIMECQNTSEHSAYPVFYDVEPTEIRKQSGMVGRAFRNHENKEAACKWRKALNEAGNLAGWELKKTANGDESKLIQDIVDAIFEKKCSSSTSVDGTLVGMETRIDDFLSSLELDAHGVRMIGIWGMGGGGKTTLAKAVFDRISIQFDGKAFVENVREVSESSMNKLQKQILSSVLSNKNITVNSVHEGTNMMKTLLRGRKVLIVLDDVNDRKQFEALAGEPDWFKWGSRVIITSRDKQVLLARGVKVIDVNLLSCAEAMLLLCKNAFKGDIPIEGYEDLSKQVVEYADGLPLTIEVLGSMLYGQEKHEWVDTLERLRTIPLKETLEKLELSYKSLDDDYKQIFLDVACILKGWDKDDAVIALESCGFHARNGLRVLEQRSLINIHKYGKLWMHDHIEEMGMNIVRRMNLDEPQRHSRLWIHEEIKDVLLANNSVKEEKWWWKLVGKKTLVEGEKATPSATQCIRRLEVKHSHNKIISKGLANMKELRFLHLITYASKGEVSNNLKLPNGLRFLRWDLYPYPSLPKTFQPNYLVGLQMHNSFRMVQLWKDGEEKPFPKLRFLKFTESYLRTLDLSVAPNLETLILEHCYNLVEVHLQVTPHLKELRINYCRTLEKLHKAECPKLTYLNISGCEKLRTLDLSVCPNLETLIFGGGYNLVEVHSQVTPHLKELRINSCRSLEKLHMVECPKLTYLNLSWCEKLRTLHLGVTPNLETLRVQHCNDMVEFHIPAKCPKLRSLQVNECSKFRNLHLGITPNLETLRLKDCYGIVELQMPAESPKLRYLSLDSCLMLRNLHIGVTPNLKDLWLMDCSHMVELCMPAECPKLVDVVLNNLKLSTLHLGITPNLKSLRVSDCIDMVKLHMHAECPKLVNLHLSNLKLRTFHLGITPNLETTSLHNCCDLVELQISFECPKLFNLDLCNCIQVAKLPEKIGRLECLKELDITETSISRLPESIFRLKGLRIAADRQLLESCGFTSKIETSEYKTFCYI